MNILDVFEAGDAIGGRVKKVIVYGALTLALVAPTRFQELITQAAREETDRIVKLLTINLAVQVPESTSPKTPAEPAKWHQRNTRDGDHP